MENRILPADDERDIVDLLTEVLHSENFCGMEAAYAGSDIVARCHSYPSDMAMLDIMRLDIDGIEVCRRIRVFSHCSLLFLSSKNDDIEKNLGLACGGEDYVIKQFNPKEIVYRIEARMRRRANYHQIGMGHLFSCTAQHSAAAQGHVEECSRNMCFHFATRLLM